MSAMVHIVGMYVQVGNLLRQRCTWCGAVLIDYDLENVMVPDGQDGPSTLPVGRLVRVDDVVTLTLDHVDGDALPEDACARLDPAVTV